MLATVLGVLVIGVAQPLPARRFWLALFAWSLAVAIAAVELRQAYPVGTPRSFPHAFATNHLQNFNLTETLIAGQSVLKGRGNTLPIADGSTKIDTYRMPGYALFVAMADAIFRAPAPAPQRLRASTAYLQALSFA